VRSTIERDGQLGSLQAIGATVLANACGPCIGQWRRPQGATAKPNAIVTSYNRNFPARNDGQRTTLNFIASPEIATALAIAGRLSFNPLTDTLTAADGKPFKLTPPAPAPEVPSRGFATTRSQLYRAPPADAQTIRFFVDPASERIQLLKPWQPWNGHDFNDMPVLIKTRGKTTTDAISPAGTWLRYRGNLERFSDNLLLGAVNAYTDEVGKTSNVLTGQHGEPIAKTARAYQENKLPWVIVGDSNYGEGSSREHAALCPRYLGGVAVIARSFARIHESNLKKQGLLALTFADSADYDRIRADDRLSLRGLRSLKAHEPVECRITHADGSTQTLWLQHSFTDAQLQWFYAGSALNCLRESA